MSDDEEAACDKGTDDEPPSEEEEEDEVLEPRLKIEKVPAVLWRTYVEKFSQGKKDAPSSLDKVTRKIAEIITIAEESQYPAMLSKWKLVRTEIVAAVADGRQAAYTIRA